MKIKKLILFIVLIVSLLPTTYCQQPTPDSLLRISILTCGTGEELYASFGHSAVRIIDSSANTDVVYNYGTFNFSDPDFYSKFTKGKLPYYINDDNYEQFINTYKYEQRSVYEQVLQVNTTDAHAIQSYLHTNLKPENKFYKYDFCFDNCSTRIRDIFNTCFGKRYSWGYVIANDSVSYRTILDHYLQNKHWERFGINMLMSNKVDACMSNESSMFLPDYLMKGFRQATLDAKPIVAQTIEILPSIKTDSTTTNIPKAIFWVLFFLILMFSMQAKYKNLLRFFDIVYFFILGLLGILMLFMWFGTEHASCTWNRNLFIFLPTHLVFAFILSRNNTYTATYAKYALWILLFAVCSSLVASQKYMSELTPIILLTAYRLSVYARTLFLNSILNKYAFTRNK